MFYSGYDKIDTHPDALIVRKPASGEEPLPALGTLVALTPTEDRRLAPRSTLRHIIFGPDNADSRDQFSRSTACAHTRATRINVGLQGTADVRMMIRGSYVP